MEVQALILQINLQIQWLPHAIQVSSVTEQGLDELKQAVLDLMAEENWLKKTQEMLIRDSETLNEVTTGT